MRKLLTLCLNLLLFTTIFGQIPQDVVLNTPITENTTATARNSVTLSPGFHAPAGLEFDANIDITLLVELQTSGDVLTAVPDGGDGIFTYLWSTGETTSSITTSGSGIYSVKVTEGLGQQVVKTLDFANTINHFDHHFVKTETALTAVKTESELDALNENDKSTSFTYFDGLGRAIQTVAVKASPIKNDIVQHIKYDELGRQAKEYLPYTVVSKYGALREEANSELENFYFTNTDGANDIFPYTEKTYDGSPLSKVTQQNAPGATWHNGQGHNNEFVKETNSVEIDRWNVDNNGNCIKDDANSYAINELYRFGTNDENGIWSYEYKDKRGNLILTKTEGHETYYVYDLLNRLAYIIPPKAIDAITGTTIPTDVYNELVYAYKYDEKGRVISKKIPGAGEVYMVYDNLNRLVLSQDAVKRENNEWNFIKYDLYGRPVLSGIVVSATETHESLQTYFNDYTGVMYEDKDPTLTFGYTLNNSFSTLSVIDADVYSATYYDNYEYLEDFTFTVITPTGYTTPDPNVNTTGQQTGSQVRIMGTNDYLLSISHYDEKGRVIRTDSHNQLDGENHVFFEYDFTGKVLKSYSQTIINEGAADEIENILITEYEYDHAGRLINEYSNTSTSAVTEVLLANREYNELGSLKAKNLHSTDNGSTFLQTVDYKYNIRGWLTHINDPDNTGNDLFSQKLFFNDVNTNGETVDPLFNGNIAGTEWKTTGNKMAYNYSYDNLNRITNAYYGDETDWNNGLYDVQGIGYDKNGNIEALSRNAGLINGEIDNLEYVYTGNKLQAVGDNSLGDASLGFKDGYSGVAMTEYNYDANGNMIEDKNKGVLIGYNMLNLPEVVYINASSSSRMNYNYNAAGNKLSALLSSPNNYLTYDKEGKYYLGNFIYDYSKTYTSTKLYTESFDIAYILTSQGRITFDASGNLQYEYFLHDHLGNVRASFSDYDNNGTAELLQQDHYYPFGMQMPGLSGIYNGATNNNYLYNGKELHTKMGIDWHDYGSRYYDAALARWHAIDPQAEKYSSLSAYNYCANNPIYYVDPNGESLVGGLLVYAAGSFVIQTLDNMINKDMSFSESINNTIWGTGNTVNLDGQDYSMQSKYAPNDTYPGYFDDMNNNDLAQSNGDWQSGAIISRTNKMLETTEKFSSIASYSAGAVGTVQIAMSEFRKMLTIPQQMLTISRFNSTYQVLGSTRNVLGNFASYVGVPLTVYSDYQSWQSGDISLGRFGYRTGSVGAATGTGAMIGGPWGAAAGAFVGGVSAGFEYIYDNYLVPFGNEIQYQFYMIEESLKPSNWY